MKTGTFKKYRGMVPPGSWSGNSNSGHNNKQNGHSTTTRLGSADLTHSGGGPFSTDAFWTQEKQGSLPVDPSSTVKEDLGYEDPIPIPSDVGCLDYATVTRGSGQLLTFSSSTLKSNSGKEEKGRRGSKNKSISRSNSESSQDQTKLGGDHPGSETASSHYTFGLNPAVVVETTDSDNEEDRNSYQEAVSNELPNNLSSNPVKDPSEQLGEPNKNRSSYGSSIGYIDEESEKRDKMAASSTLDRKIYASKASSMFGHIIKTDSPPDLDKQNSWPRTLSSFMGGKEPLKFAVSEINQQPSTKERHSFQIIPLQVRPSTPSGMSTFNPKMSPGVHSPFSDTASLPDRSMPHHHHSHHHHHHHAATPDRYVRTVQDTSVPDRYTRTLPTQHNSNRSWPTNEEADECKVTVSGPNMRFCVPQGGPLKIQSGVQTETPPPDPETFRIWEEQGLVSPSEAMFSESAASRL